MKTGDIFVWVTDRAQGHALRKKYHVYICDAGWRAEGHAFLFVNKSDFNGGYAIRKADYNFFDLDTSYVGLSNIVTYSDANLASFRPEHLGRLTQPHMAELHSAIAGSEIMEQWQIALVCDALKPSLG
jgi:hypothetical protein